MLLFDICEAEKPHGMILAEAILEAVKQGDKEMPMGWKHLSRYLSEKEKADMRTDVAQRMLDIFRNLPSEKEFEASAHAGQAKKGWYAASAKSLMEVFGPDTPRFAALLASLSPQVSVKENLRNAIKFWEIWIDAGRPMTEKGIDEVGKQALGRRWMGDLKPDGSTKAGMGYRPNALRAMTYAEQRGLGVVIHNQSLGIAAAVQIHLAAARYSCLGHDPELFGHIMFEDDLITAPLEYEPGRVKVPTGPGWGVEVDEAALEKYATGRTVKIVKA